MSYLAEPALFTGFITLYVTTQQMVVVTGAKFAENTMHGRIQPALLQARFRNASH